MVVLLALLLVAGPLSGRVGALTGDTRNQALQSCPPTEEEIVDLEILAGALKETRAVGFVEKLRLKSAIDKLIERMLDFHSGKSRFTLAELQEQYDLLLIRITMHLQHKDAILHGQLCNAWETIWQDLEDPDSFAEQF